MTPGLYAYGIVASGSLGEPPRAAGVDPAHPPRLVEVAGLTAIVSRVDVAEFEGDALERNVATPEWLELKVRAHELVLDEVVAATSVVPMRFGSIFSAESGLRAMVAGHSRDLRAALDRVRGKDEWGVKVHCDHAALVERLVGASGPAASGRGYLVQKKARLEAEAVAAGAAGEVAAEVHGCLGEAAAEAVTSGAGRSGAVLNGAYLVPAQGREAFMRLVENLERRHEGAFTFEVTGPWPPYNFTSADVGGPRP